MSISCFPVAMRAPQDSGAGPSADIDLFVEIAGSLFGLIHSLLAKVWSVMQPQVVSANPESHKVALARDAAASPALLDALSQDKNTIVRNAVLFNPALPASVLRRMAFDSDLFIASQARARLG